MQELGLEREVFNEWIVHLQTFQCRVCALENQLIIVSKIKGVIDQRKKRVVP